MQQTLDKQSYTLYNGYCVWSYIMFIHLKVPKTKKRKVPKQQQADYDAWLKSIEDMKPKSLSKTKMLPQIKSPVVQGVYVRETRKIQSLDTGGGVATKAPPKIYTGTMVKGIATMHKSNAVPVFTDQEAKDISSMRR